MRAFIPNTLSISNQVLGFISILVATDYNAATNSNHLFWAAILIFIAFFLDGIDGPMARLLKVNEKGLGAQLDSLADLTTFGIAPGFLMYQAIFHSLGSVVLLGITIPAGLLLAASYPACTAYRLARFNVTHSPNHFQGLPSPVAALLVALFIVYSHKEPNFFNSGFVLSAYLLLAFLMVSTIKYSKPDKNLRNKWVVFKLFLFVSLILSLTLIFHISIVKVFFALVGFYVFTGIIMFIILLIKKYRF